MNLVTGATGHIGNVLVRRLVQQGERVRAFVLPDDDLAPLKSLQVDIMVGNILHKDTIRKAMRGVTRVFHLAGLVSILPGQADLLEAINVDGTRNMLQAASEFGVERFVYTSSIHALGQIPHGQIINEEVMFDLSRVMGDYDRSKARASLLVMDAARNGLDTIIVCPTGVIGPFDYKKSEMGSLIENTIQDICVFSVRGAYDFVDVRDVVEGIILAAEKGSPGSVYILSGEYINIQDILTTARETTGRKIPIIEVPFQLARLVSHISPVLCSWTKKKAHFTSYSLETIQSNSIVTHQKATVELDYHPRQIRESIRDTIHWFIDQKSLQTTQTGRII